MKAGGLETLLVKDTEIQGPNTTKWRRRSRLRTAPTVGAVVDVGSGPAGTVGEDDLGRDPVGSGAKVPLPSCPLSHSPSRSIRGAGTPRPGPSLLGVCVNRGVPLCLEPNLVWNYTHEP